MQEDPLRTVLTLVEKIAEAKPHEALVILRVEKKWWAGIRGIQNDTISLTPGTQTYDSIDVALEALVLQP